MLKPIQPSTYTFQDIIQGGFLYIDKTRYLYQLIQPGKGVYFLSRSRRFGKSLMVSTLEEIFKGNQELFRGLWLYESDYAWQKHPVIRIDFSLHGVRNVQELEISLQRNLFLVAQAYQIELIESSFDIQFEDLIRKMAMQGRVVILIDEYDKPIIDNIENVAEAKLIRDTLKRFYTVIKAMDGYLRFVFMTGISKFSKVGVFSTLNHLDDLTMDQRYATALGITEQELRDNFQEHIALFAQQQGMSSEALLTQIRQWYNGFCFVRGAESVYNPFSTLKLFSKQSFNNYWFESGTPGFLIKLLKTQNYDVRSLEQLELSELAFSAYEIEDLAIIPILFQTGYLTIKGYNPQRRLYQLGYPNQEVENAFRFYLLDAFSALPNGLSESYLWKLIDALQAQDLPQFFEVLRVFFANIDYDLQLEYEKYYQTIFYLLFLLLGAHVTAEVKTNRGRIDAVIELTEQIYLFAFKLTGSALAALKQIKTMEYYQKYRLQGKTMIGVGVRFDRKKRTLATWKHEVIS